MPRRKKTSLSHVPYLLLVVLGIGAALYAKAPSGSDAGRELAESAAGGFFQQEANKVSISIVAMVTVIIVFSVFMEQFVMEPAKDAGEENPNLEPIVNTMFSELTLLGFVGLFMFIIEKIDLLSAPSYHVFGEKEMMAELFEDVHMALFLVMVLFLFNAYCMLRMSIATQARWAEANKLAMDERDDLVEKYAKCLRLKKQIPEELEFTMTFMAIRDRFVDNVGKQPEPAEEGEGEGEEGEGKKKKKKKKIGELPHDFALDSYFGKIMGDKTGEIIEVQVSTWLWLEVILIIFWFVQVPLSSFGFSCAFIIFGYLMMAGSYALDAHLKTVLSELIPPAHYEAAKAKAFPGQAGEAAPITGGGTYTSIDKARPSMVVAEGEGELRSVVQMATDDLWIPPYMQRDMRSIKKFHEDGVVRKVFFGRVPNKHEHLFFGGAEYDETLMQLIRLEALGTAIYFAIFLVVMLNPIIEKLEGHYIMMALILFVAAVPAFVNFYALSVLVSDFVVVSSVESMRDKEVIEVVKRQMVATKAMTALKLLNTMRNSLPKAGASEGEYEPVKPEEVWTDPHVYKEKEREYREMFELFDADGSDGIDEQELGHLLAMMGIGNSEEERKMIFEQLDQPDPVTGERDGDICFAEFFAWIASHEEAESGEVDEKAMEEMAEQLFDLIDQPDPITGERDGEISPQEFYQCMHKLASNNPHAKLEISLQDVEALFRDVDEDCNGNLDREEFQEMLEKYMGE